MSEARDSARQLYRQQMKEHTYAQWAAAKRAAEEASAPDGGHTTSKQPTSSTTTSTANNSAAGKSAPQSHQPGMKIYDFARDAQEHSRGT